MELISVYDSKQYKLVEKSISAYAIHRLEQHAITDKRKRKTCAIYQLFINTNKNL